VSEPRIVAFLCNWCAYAAADAAGRAKLGIPQGLLSVRVMCTGRVEPAFVLQAFREGADGVLVAGCHPGDCHYVDGNLRAAARHAMLAGLLEQLGVSRERFRLEWIGASEPDRLVRIAREMSERLRALGPLRAGDAALDGAARALAGGRAAPEEACGPAEGLGAAPGGAPRGAAAGPRPGEAASPAEGASPARREAPGKPRIAFYWNASCGGCEEAVLDLDEDLLRVLDRVEVVLWPVALDHKRKDVEALADGSIAVTFLNGAVRLEEQAEWAHLLRRKSRWLVAFGACAHTGGIVGLGNLATPDEILETAYRTLPSVANPEGTVPGRAAGSGGPEAVLPLLLPAAVPLSRVVDVDYVVPGCPPSPPVVARAVDRLLSGDLPPRGAVLAPAEALCEACERRDSRPERLQLTALADLATVAPDPATCFLAQGISCMGPATRRGCEPGCLGANMPCRGCFGPTDGAPDPGSAMLSATASLLRGDPADLARLAGRALDPAGTFFRYGLAASTLPGRAGGGR
jgi:F420-non-reducing hydrogenase small subunit